jgi:hypothetical protein
MPTMVNAFLWVDNPAAAGSQLTQVFTRAEATEMNGANAREFSHAANDMFSEYRWEPVEIRQGVYVVAGKSR